MGSLCEQVLSFCAKNYNPADIHTFKIVWTPRNVYFILNEFEYSFVQLGPYGPIEAFSRILIGDDETYNFRAVTGRYSMISKFFCLPSRLNSPISPADRSVSGLVGMVPRVLPWPILIRMG
jgi:hypothetical protein